VSTKSWELYSEITHLVSWNTKNLKEERTAEYTAHSQVFQAHLIKELVPELQICSYHRNVVTSIGTGQNFQLHYKEHGQEFLSRGSKTYHILIII